MCNGAQGSTSFLVLTLFFLFLIVRHPSKKNRDVKLTPKICVLFLIRTRKRVLYSLFYNDKVQTFISLCNEVP